MRLRPPFFYSISDLCISSAAAAITCNISVTIHTFNPITKPINKQDNKILYIFIVNLCKIHLHVLVWCVCLWGGSVIRSLRSPIHFYCSINCETCRFYIFCFASFRSFPVHFWGSSVLAYVMFYVYVCIYSIVYTSSRYYKCCKMKTFCPYVVGYLPIYVYFS